MARRLARPVMMTDPNTGRGITLLPGTVPPPDLAALIRNPKAWEDEPEPEEPPAPPAEPVREPVPPPPTPAPEPVEPPTPEPAPEPEPAKKTAPKKATPPEQPVLDDEPRPQP